MPEKRHYTDYRKSLSDRFLRRLNADFRKHGIATIEQVRQEAPVAYLKLCALAMPKELQVDVRHDFSAVLEAAAQQLPVAEAAAAQARLVQGDERSTPLLEGVVLDVTPEVEQLSPADIEALK